MPRIATKRRIFLSLQSLFCHLRGSGDPVGAAIAARRDTGCPHFCIDDNSRSESHTLAVTTNILLTEVGGGKLIDYLREKFDTKFTMSWRQEHKDNPVLFVFLVPTHCVHCVSIFLLRSDGLRTRFICMRAYACLCEHDKDCVLVKDEVGT